MPTYGIGMMTLELDTYTCSSQLPNTPSSNISCLEGTPEKKVKLLAGLLPPFQILATRDFYGKSGEMENKTPVKMTSVFPKRESVTRSLFGVDTPPRLALSTIQDHGTKISQQQSNSKKPLIVKPKLVSVKRQRKSFPSRNCKKARLSTGHSGVGHGICKPKPSSKKVKVERQKKTQSPRTTSIYSDKIENSLSSFKTRFMKSIANTQKLTNNLEALNPVWPAEDDSDIEDIQVDVTSIVERLENDTTNECKPRDSIPTRLTEHSTTMQSTGSSSSPCKEQSPMKEEKIKEVEDLLNKVFGDFDTSVNASFMHCSPSETHSFNSSLSDESSFRGFSRSEANQQDLKDLELLVEKLNQSDYIDPNDSDPFAEFDSDELSITVNSESEESFILKLNSQECTQEILFLAQNDVKKSTSQSMVDKMKAANCVTEQVVPKESDNVELIQNTSKDSVTLELEDDISENDIIKVATESLAASPEIVKKSYQNDFTEVLPESSAMTGEICDPVSLSMALQKEKTSCSEHETMVVDQPHTDNDKSNNQSESDSITHIEKEMKLTDNVDSESNISTQSKEICVRNGETKSSEPVESTVNITSNSTSDSSESFYSAESSPSVADVKKTDSNNILSKLFPVFRKGNAGTNKRSSTPPKLASQRRRTLPMQEKDGKEQLLLDAGQKKFGMEVCEECSFVYDPDVRQDVETHAIHHHRHENHPRHLGWKNEVVVADFQEEGRILMVQEGDPNSWWKRVSQILETVNYDLGFCEDQKLKPDSKAFLYIWEKNVVGCVIAENISSAHRMLPGPDFLSTEESFSAICGISRIWTSKSLRRRGFAVKLMNAVRKNFLCHRDLELSEIAFSSPTEHGRAFATKYLKTPTFLVY